MIRRHTPFQEFQEQLLSELMQPQLRVPDELGNVNPLARMDMSNTAGPVQALLRAWSVVGDVLTFYQERIGEERVLSSAREDFSAYAIARMLGQQPRPQLSARTWLCFEAAGADPEIPVTVPARTAIGNVPQEGKLPAIFETSEDLQAYPAWNAVPAAVEALPAFAKLTPYASRVVLEGSDRIAPGSVLVLRVQADADVRSMAFFISDTMIDRARDVTLVRWESLPQYPIAGGEEIVEAQVLELRVRPFGALAPPYASASPAERHRYAHGGVAVRKNETWQLFSSSVLDDAPDALAFGRNALFGIKGARLFRLTVGGAWTSAPIFAASPAQSIAVTANGRLVIGTATGTVLISIDDGLTWSALGDGLGAPARKLARNQMLRLPAIPIRGIAVDESGEVPMIFVATDRGVASMPLSGDVWTWRNAGFPGTDPKTGVASLSVTSVTIADAQGTLLATTTYGVYRSTRGEAWQRIQGLGSVSAIAPLAENRLIAIGPGGVFISGDGEDAWSKAFDVAGAPRALAADAQCAIVAVGRDVYTTDDGGVTWTHEPDMLQAEISAVAAGRDGAFAFAAPFVEDPGPDWPGLILDGDTLRLDRELAIVPGDIVTLSLEDGAATVCEAYTVRSSATAMLAEYGIVGVSTQLKLDRTIAPSFRNARQVLVHVSGRSRTVLRTARQSFAPPVDRIAVARGLTPLPLARRIAVEGSPARILLAAAAGGPISLDGASIGSELPMLRSESAILLPVLDVDAVAGDGEYGIVLARFDGVWRCEDVRSAPWQQLPPLDGRVSAVALFSGTVFAACGGNAVTGLREGVYELTERGWTFVLGATVRRLVAARGALWACADTGLFRFDRSAWSIADQCFEGRGVNDVAADDAFVLAGTDDGAYVWRQGAWNRISGLDGVAVSCTAISAGVFYAGTSGAGTWMRRSDAAMWTSADGHRPADVQALFAADGAIIAAERGFGLTQAGAPIEDVPLASNVKALIGFGSGQARRVVVFRGTPLVPSERTGGAPAPMRRCAAVIAYDANCAQTLDAGLLDAALRMNLERTLGVKLGSAEIVVEDVGRAWRIQSGDVLPVYLIRREPNAFSVFETARFELDSPPSPLAQPDGVLAWKLLGNWDRAPVVFARETQMWYAAAAAGSSVRSEVVALAAQSEGEVAFDKPFANAYDPLTIKLCGNVVEATHGATVPRDEPILSGNAGIPGQQASLKSAPLTNLMQADGSIAPALDVWVRADVAPDGFITAAEALSREREEDMVRWTLVPDFFASDAQAPHFMLRQDAQGAATLTFGDGQKGRRVPTGTDNVIARYRVGGGPDGNVEARTLTLFQRPHSGLQRVYNPLPAHGGAQAHRVPDLRKTAALGMISLDRIVSQRDVKDYVAAWPGIDKVDLTRKRRKTRSSAHVQLIVTYASRSNGVDIANLDSALRGNGAQHFDLRFLPYRERRFGVNATLFVDRDHDADTVVRAAIAGLVQAYSFNARNLREDVRESSIVALLQRVRGVRAVSIEELAEISGMRAVDGRLAGDDGAGDEAASLLVIDPQHVVIEVRTA